MKQISFTTFWGDVGVKKCPRFFYSDTQSPIFGHLKAGTFGKSAHFWVLKSGTLRAQIQKRRARFHANIPPKWWYRHLSFCVSTFGWIKSQFKNWLIWGLWNSAFNRYFLSLCCHWWGVKTMPKALPIPRIMCPLVTDEGLTTYLTIFPKEKRKKQENITYFSC